MSCPFRGLKIRMILSLHVTHRTSFPKLQWQLNISHFKQIEESIDLDSTFQIKICKSAPALKITLLA